MIFMTCRPVWVSTAGLALLLCVANGCSSRQEALERETAALRRELSQLRATGAAMQDRLDMLEEAGTSRADNGDESEADESAAPADRPKLDVVHLAPTDAKASEGDPAAPPEGVLDGAALEEGPRPVITGDARGVRDGEGRPQPTPPRSLPPRAPHAGGAKRAGAAQP
jgi:hypothetical protein